MPNIPENEDAEKARRRYLDRAWDSVKPTEKDYRVSFTFPGFQGRCPKHPAVDSEITATELARESVDVTERCRTCGFQLTSFRIVKTRRVAGGMERQSEPFLAELRSRVRSGTPRFKVDLDDK